MFFNGKSNVNIKVGCLLFLSIHNHTHMDTLTKNGRRELPRGSHEQVYDKLKRIDVVITFLFYNSEEEEKS